MLSGHNIDNQLDHHRSDSSTQAGLSSMSGGVYEGVITGYLKANEQYMVRIRGDSTRTPVVKCVWAAGYFSNLLGFNINFSPTIGTNVTVFYPGGGIGYVIGTSSQSTHINEKGMNRRVTTGGKLEQSNASYQQQEAFQQLRKKWNEGATEKNLNSNRFYTGSNPAGDLVEGEFDLSNSLGVGLQLIRHFACLKGSDFAKVEASIIDDMVRIVSQTFRHFSAFGDYKIVNDSGRLNVVWDGTTNDWETYGKDNENDPRVEKDGKATVSIEKDKFTNLAKWRFSSYIGFLGDFINLFVTDKLDVKKPEEHMERSGKGRIHVGEDGNIVLQTVADIAFERVCRIPVPLQKKPEHDDEGDGEQTNGELPFPSDKEPIKSWDWNASGGVDKSFWCVYQLRDYGRWMSNYYTKARFHQLKEDWEVPPEAQVKEPLRKDSDEKDKKEANAGIPETYIDVYSAIRMYRDGSISLSDGYENTIVMNENGVNVSSATNLQLEAAGSVNIVAGRDCNVVARNSVDLNALKGGMSLRSENFHQTYCKNGGILLETETSVGPVIYNDDAIDMPDAEQTDPRKIGGIVLWSKNSSMRLLSKTDMGLRSEQGFQIFRGAVQLWDSDAPMLFKKQLLLLGDFALLKGLMWQDGAIIKDLYIGNDYKSIFEHPGHVIGDNDEEKITGPPDDPFTMFDEILDQFKSRNWDGKFKHRKDKEYGTQKFGDPKAPDAIYESLTQQGLRMTAQNVPIGAETAYSEFNVSKDTELPGRGYAWPGESKQHWHMPSTVNGDDKLWQPSGTKEWKNKGTPLTLTDIKLKRLV